MVEGLTSATPPGRSSASMLVECTEPIALREESSTGGELVFRPSCIPEWLILLLALSFIEAMSHLPLAGADHLLRRRRPLVAAAYAPVDRMLHGEARLVAGVGVLRLGFLHPVVRGHQKSPVARINSEPPAPISLQPQPAVWPAAVARRPTELRPAVPVVEAARKGVVSAAAVAPLTTLNVVAVGAAAAPTKAMLGIATIGTGVSAVRSQAVPAALTTPTHGVPTEAAGSAKIHAYRYALTISCSVGLNS